MANGAVEFDVDSRHRHPPARPRAAGGERSCGERLAAESIDEEP
jgi:hypothetical protein